MTIDYKNWVCPVDKMKTKKGIQLTEGLFYETRSHNSKVYEPTYTIKDHDHNGYPSAYLIYMNSVDEYEAAIKLVGSLRHWRKLEGLKWFMDGRTELSFEGLKQWREDMELRDKSISKEQLIEKAKEGNVAAMRSLQTMSRKKTSNKTNRTTVEKKTKDEAVVSLLKRMNHQE